MMLATEELRRQARQHAHHTPLTARRLADFLVSVEAEQALLPQRLRDSEARAVLQRVQGRLASGKPSDRGTPLSTARRDVEIPPVSGDEPVRDDGIVKTRQTPPTVYADY
jgi:hypothetical protein